MLEAFMTGDEMWARTSYREGRIIDPKRYAVSLTSNGMHMTDDLMRRSCITSIEPRAPDYQWHLFDGLSVLDHMRAKQPYYLACVYKMLTHWHDKGKQTLPCGDMGSFTVWFGSMNWIMQNIFNLPATHLDQDAGAVKGGPQQTLRVVCQEIKPGEHPITVRDLMKQVEHRRDDICEPGESLKMKLAHDLNEVTGESGTITAHGYHIRRSHTWINKNRTNTYHFDDGSFDLI
jgi:hypothetical protein